MKFRQTEKKKKKNVKKITVVTSGLEVGESGPSVIRRRGRLGKRCFVSLEILSLSPTQGENPFWEVVKEYGVLL